MKSPANTHVHILDAHQFSTRLLNWFDLHGRKDLPWQSDINAYRVWVSEIMLQQTQVKTVIDYFTRFMQRFPLVTDLAAASEDEVLHLWTGLGYYARARNLHKTAIIVTEQFNGEFPIEPEALNALPGIGRSTAGAIAAIAYSQHASILDGNVKRVLARYYGIDGWPGQTQVAAKLWDIADELTPAKRVADYTQAIMDMGATLCKRSKPACELCPFETDCVAKQTDRVTELPGKKAKKVMPVKTTLMLMIENKDGELYLYKRPNTGLWGGLWSFPQCTEAELQEALIDHDAAPETVERLEEFRHTFTHFHLDITPIRVKSQTDNQGFSHEISEVNNHVWYRRESTLEIGLTRPVTKLLEQLKF